LNKAYLYANYTFCVCRLTGSHNADKTILLEALEIVNSLDGDNDKFKKYIDDLLKSIEYSSITKEEPIKDSSSKIMFDKKNTSYRF